MFLLGEVRGNDYQQISEDGKKIEEEERNKNREISHEG